jgi:NAD(P)-dependent dehydrogenase (short-subunit alcohol dehydrogenase family)
MSNQETKVALVTGAATGIGYAAALLFAKEGYIVVAATSRNKEGLDKTVCEIEEAGGQAEAFLCDISKESDIEKMVGSVVEKYGRIDCAFNNAGVGPDGVRIPYGPLTDLSEETWDKIMDVNLKGTFFCLKHELRQMAKQGYGAIVNTSSIGGLRMVPGFGAYGPSKAGVVALTQLSALEYAKAGVRVNAICPGPTLDTELMKNTIATGSRYLTPDIPGIDNPKVTPVAEADEAAANGSLDGGDVVVCGDAIREGYFAAMAVG